MKEEVSQHLMGLSKAFELLAVASTIDKYDAVVIEQLECFREVVDEIVSSRGDIDEEKCKQIIKRASDGLSAFGASQTAEKFDRNI